MESFTPGVEPREGYFVHNPLGLTSRRIPDQNAWDVSFHSLGIPTNGDLLKMRMGSGQDLLSVLSKVKTTRVDDLFDATATAWQYESNLEGTTLDTYNDRRQAVPVNAITRV